MTNLAHDKAGTCHISLALCTDIHEICKPLFSCLPIAVFEYCRVFSDGSRSILCNHKRYVENVMNQWKREIGIASDELSRSSQRYILTDVWVESLDSNIRQQLINSIQRDVIIFGRKSEIVLVNKDNKSFCEHFHFYSSSHLHSSENIFLNNLDLLEHFVTYFVNTAADLIQKITSDKIIKPWRHAPPNGHHHFQEASVIDRENFIKKTIPKRIYITSKEGVKTYLTKREIECISHVLEGKSAREIAKSLFLSLRTIETYLESLRIKTGCLNRSKLINYFNRSNLVHTLKLLQDKQNSVSQEPQSYSKVEKLFLR